MSLSILSEILQQKEKVKKDNPDNTITIWEEKIKLKADFNMSRFIRNRLF